MLPLFVHCVSEIDEQKSAGGDGVGADTTADLAHVDRGADLQVGVSLNGDELVRCLQVGVDTSGIVVARVGRLALDLVKGEEILTKTFSRGTK